MSSSVLPTKPLGFKLSSCARIIIDATGKPIGGKRSLAESPGSQRASLVRYLTSPKVDSGRADRAADRENADHEMELRFFLMLAEMRVQAHELWKHGTSKTALRSAGASATVHSNGAAGAL